MKFSQKRILFCLVLITGMLLYHVAFLQLNDAIKYTLLSPESNTSENNYSSSTDAYEDDQIFHEIKLQLVSRFIIQPNPLQVSGRFSRPNFAVWQPPNNG